MDVAPAGSVQVVVASSLNDSVDRDRFLELSRATHVWMHEQPGFLRYELIETQSGWLDTMLWQDQASADAGNSAFAETEIAEQFARIVKPAFTAFSGKAVALL